MSGAASSVRDTFCDRSSRRKPGAGGGGSSCRSQTYGTIPVSLPLRAPGFRPELRWWTVPQNMLRTWHHPNAGKKMRYFRRCGYNAAVPAVAGMMWCGRLPWFWVETIKSRLPPGFYL